TLTLTDSQKLRDVLMSLSASATSIHGDVTMLSDGGPASGVTVTIETGSDTPVTTVTQSGATAGSWSASGLPVPGAYTITFSRADLQPQTVSVALNSAGVPTSGADADGAITVAMRSATGEVTGIVYQRGDSDRAPVGEAT